VFWREEYARVAAIHHSLSNVKTSASEIGSFIYIDHTADWPAGGFPSEVTGANVPLSARLISTAHCTGASGTRVKDQRNAVARWNLNQATDGFGSLKLLGCADNSGLVPHGRVLVVHRTFRVTRCR